jgi:hypothetical protein
MSRPHDPADMRDLLLEALDETGREYELIDKLASPISEMAPLQKDQRALLHDHGQGV